MSKTTTSRNRVLVFVLMFGLLSVQAAGAEAGTVFVAVNGSDSWSGLLADPLLAEFDKGTVSFAPDSPAHKLGIEPIDVSTAGPRRQ